MTTRNENAIGSRPMARGIAYQEPANLSLEFSKQQHPAAPAKAKLNHDTKRAAVLRVFLERGERGLNCFEAVPLAHDYVLRTTVSECARYHGIEFAKRFECVPGHAGSRVDCVRYSLTAGGVERARELLGESLEAACG